MDIRSTLIHAATRYDRAQEKKRHYNIYALAQYMTRIDDVMDEHEKTKRPVDEILKKNFNDRLLDVLLKSIEK